MRARLRPIAAVALGLFLAAGCGPTSVYSRSETAGVPSVQRDLEGHEWVLDRPASSLTGDDGELITLTIDGDAVSGRGPCNSYHGHFELDEHTVHITDLAMTKMACEPPTMRAEDEWVAALTAVDHAEVNDDGDRMVLKGDGVHLEFDALPAE